MQKNDLGFLVFILFLIVAGIAMSGNVKAGREKTECDLRFQLAGKSASDSLTVLRKYSYCKVK
jgi:hypothetical protein